MRALACAVIMLMACNNATTTSSYDMTTITQPDMTQGITQDMGIIDLSQPTDMACDTQSDPDNCGARGHSCGGTNAICQAGQCFYTHHDSLCNGLFYIANAQWQDQNANVGGSNATQARDACNACISTAKNFGYSTSAACGMMNYTDATNTYTGYGTTMIKDGVTSAIVYWYDISNSSLDGTGWGWHNFVLGSNTPDYTTDWTN